MEINTYSLYNQYTSKLFVYKNSIWFSAIGKPKLKEIEERENDRTKIKRHKEYSFKTISSIITNETSEQVKIKHVKNGKNKTTRLHLSDMEQKIAFISDIESANFFKKSMETENPTKQNISNFIFAPLVLALAYYILSIESIDNSALHTDRYYKNRWVLDLLVLVIETIGQTNTAILLVVIALFIIYKIVMRYRQPKNNIILVNPNLQ